MPCQDMLGVWVVDVTYYHGSASCVDYVLSIWMIEQAPEETRVSNRMLQFHNSWRLGLFILDNLFLGSCKR